VNRRPSFLLHTFAPAMLTMAAALVLYLPTLSLDFHLLDEPGDTLYSFKMVEALRAHPSISALRSQKDPNRLTPVHYLYHYTVSRIFGLRGPAHHAVHLGWLFIHLLLLVWLFRVVTGTGWWAVLAGFFYLLFIPDDWNSTPYNFYTLFTLEPLIIALLGTWCGLAAQLARHPHMTRIRQVAAWTALALLAVVLLFTKETALFYSPGVAVLGLFLWRRSGKWRSAVAAVAIYAAASLLFLACYLSVIGWNTGVDKELMPGAGPAQRAYRIVCAFLQTFGPLLLLVPASHLAGFFAKSKGIVLDTFADLDLVALAFLLPSLAQLIIWPNFQLRLLLPHGFLVSASVTLSAWRLYRIARLSSAFHGATIVRRLAVAGLVAAALCLPMYATFAGMAMHNFRLLLRANELTRVAAYKKCRDLLQPGNRLFVAIMRGDQVYHEIGWRLSFFDHLQNPVIELQPGSERPRAGDVIYYHKRMARVTAPIGNLDTYTFEEHGDAFLNVGWTRWFAAIWNGKFPGEQARGGNEYTVYKVRQPQSNT
jgi:hypothetical protein